MLNAFLSGAIAMGCLVVVGYFFRFWQHTRDRLFLFFAAAFLIFIVERILRTLLNLENEFAPFVYSTRLIAFSLIIAGIVDKNSRREKQ
jgi:hypothetical protein